MALNLSKYLAVFKNAKSRTMVILFGGIIIVGTVIAVLQGGKKVDLLAKKGSSSAPVPTSIRNVPGAQTSEAYRELQQEENERRAQEAIKQRTSAIPTIISAIKEDPNEKKDPISLEEGLAESRAQDRDFFDLSGPQKSGLTGQGLYKKTAREKEIEAREKRMKEQRDRLERIRLEKEAKLERERQSRIQAAKDQEYRKEVEGMKKQMRKYLTSAYKDWVDFPKQTYKTGSLHGKKYEPAPLFISDIVDEEGKTKMAKDPTGRFDHKVTGKQQKKRNLIKAGSILYAVLETGINTDEPSPILARIVHGKLKGSKLIGKVAHGPKQEKLLLSFQTMTIPKRQASFGVKMVAIDPDTARTVLAGDLDKHLFIRYGSLFASSFIEGYAKVISRQGTTTTAPNGTTTETKTELSGKKEFFAALGLVGQKWGQQIATFINMPYTIKIDAGTGIGLLVMSDTDVTPDEEE